MTPIHAETFDHLRNATVSAGLVQPDGSDIVTVTDGLAGRPMGAAYGRPFLRSGLRPDCSHHRCWEPTPLTRLTPLAKRTDGDGPYVRQLRDEPRRALALYRPGMPPERWQSIQPFVNDAVAIAAPACHYLAERLLVVFAQYVDWVVNVCGYALNEKAVFHPVMIRRYVSRTDMTWKDKTRRDYRSLLLRISEVIVPDAGAVPFAALNGQSVTTPYTDLELSLLEAWARGQSTEVRRRGAGAVLALCAGAGLEPYDVQHLHRSDIHLTSRGVTVRTAGSVPRQVPVLRRWESLLLDAIRELDSGALVLGSGDRVTTFNVVTGFLRKTSRSAEPDLMPVRMRTTWLVHHLAAKTPANLVMEAAGLSKAQHLVGLLRHVPDLNNPDDRKRIITETRLGSSRRS